MIYKKFKTLNNEELSAIGYGCWAIGGTWNYTNSRHPVPADSDPSDVFRQSRWAYLNLCGNFRKAKRSKTAARKDNSWLKRS